MPAENSVGWSGATVTSSGMRAARSAAAASGLIGRRMTLPGRMPGCMLAPPRDTGWPRLHRPRGARSVGGDMDPIVCYAGFVAIALAILVVAMAFSPPARRRCPSCDEHVSISARACRCGYAFS